VIGGIPVTESLYDNVIVNWQNRLVKNIPAAASGSEAFRQPFCPFSASVALKRCCTVMFSTDVDSHDMSLTHIYRPNLWSQGNAIQGVMHGESSHGNSIFGFQHTFV
jgi:hypothetical protein